MSEVYYGSVCWFKAGYGFISWDKDGKPQKDLFAHYSDISMEGYKTLYKGQKVSFKIGTNNHGQPKAIEIKVLTH